MEIQIMKSLVLAICLLTVGSLGPAGAVAQQPTDSKEHSAHDHTVADNIAAAAEQCARADVAFDEVARAIKEAIGAPDLKTARTALESIRIQISETNQHLGSCQDILKLAKFAAATGDRPKVPAAPSTKGK